MKTDMAMFAGLLWMTTACLARAQIHGFEAAMMSTVIQSGLRGTRAASGVIDVAQRLLR
jgi:hypothetical protein